MTERQMAAILVGCLSLAVEASEPVPPSQPASAASRFDWAAVSCGKGLLLARYQESPAERDPLRTGTREIQMCMLGDVPTQRILQPTSWVPVLLAPTTPGQACPSLSIVLQEDRDRLYYAIEHALGMRSLLLGRRDRFSDRLKQAPDRTTVPRLVREGGADPGVSRVETQTGAARTVLSDLTSPSLCLWRGEVFLALDSGTALGGSADRHVWVGAVPTEPRDLLSSDPSQPEDDTLRGQVLGPGLRPVLVSSGDTLLCVAIQPANPSDGGSVRGWASTTKGQWTRWDPLVDATDVFSLGMTATGGKAYLACLVNSPSPQLRVYEVPVNEPRRARAMRVEPVEGAMLGQRVSVHVLDGKVTCLVPAWDKEWALMRLLAE